MLQLLLFVTSIAFVQDDQVANLVKQLKAPKPADRIKAVEELGKLGPLAATAGRPIVEAMMDADPKVRIAAKEAIEKVHPKLAKPVSSLLFDGRFRDDVIADLGKLGVEADAAVPAILFNTRLSKPVQSIATVPGALASIAPNDGALVKLIAGWMARSSHDTTRAACARALPKFTNGKEAIDNLIAALRAERLESPAKAMIEALGEFGPDAMMAEKVLEPLQVHKSGNIRQAAQAALEKIRKR